MSLSCRSSSAGRHAAVTVAAFALLLAMPIASHAQTAPTIVGSLANFDAVNDTEGEKEGFEIQLEGLEPNDITRVFGQSGATCYIRYCIGSITPYGTPGVAPFGVYVRWTANYNAATHTFTTPANAPGNGHGTPSRVGNNNPMPVTGEACWSLGAGAAYAESGCEHFGVSTTPGRFPSATKTVTYRWLVADPASPGNLIPASPAVVPPVPISHPVVQGDILAGAPDVQVAAPAAPPVAPAHRYGIAEWVKVYKTELDRDADLDELVGGHPNNVVPNGENHLGATETEWKLLQMDVKNPDKGSSTLVSHGTPGGGKHAIVRRYEFYKYTGPVVAPGGTSGGGKGGGPVLSTDDQEASLCPRVNGECTAPAPGEIGDFIGAQMAGQNLGNLITPVISWPVPVGIVYGTALSAAQLNAVATANGAPVSGTFSYTPPLGTFLPAGNQTLQVAFTPDDAATFGTQTMTMLMTVNKAPLTVVADRQTKVYGSPDPLFTYVASGFQGGDTAATVLTGALAAEIGSTVGSHAITQGTLTATSNYTLAFTGNTLDITAANLTITAGSDSKTYGSSFTATVFTSSGLVNGDTVASVTLTSAGAAATAGVGSYAVVPSAAAGTGLTNYAISYANGALTVTPAALVVTAGDGTKTYGASTFAAGFTSAGLVNGDSVGSVTLTSAGSAAGAAVGVYDIAASDASGAGLTNYSVSYVNGKLSVTPASLSIAANAQTKVEGTLDPPLTFVASGFQAGDVAAGVLSGALTRAAGEVPGGYAITQGTLSANANYTIGFTGNTFVITAAPPPPPPPADLSIAPIPPQTNTDGDEVELQVVVVGAINSSPARLLRTAGARLSGSETDDHGLRGTFTISGLNGLRIDNHGTICGHIKAGVTDVTLFHVVVTFTVNGSTATQEILWTVKPAPDRKGRKG